MKEAALATPNYKLKRERESRSWSQLDLADRLGTTARNVSRWERGITLPGPHFRQELCALFAKKPAELGFLETSLLEPFLDEEPDPPCIVSTEVFSPPQATAVADSEARRSDSPLWDVPYQRNPFFTGRNDILVRMHTLLTGHQSGANPFTLALSGLGGVGKTQLVVEYAYRYYMEYQAIFWVQADTRDTLLSDYARIADLLQLPECHEQDQQQIILAVKRWFHVNARWLLILDNADDSALIRYILPNLGDGHILMTTQAQATGSVARRLRVGQMTTEEGVLFLLRRARLQDTGTLQAEEFQRRSALAGAIVSAMGGLPLALDQAAAYIEETGCDIAGYLERYQRTQLALLARRGSSFDHPLSVLATWSLSFERIRRINSAAVQLLKICSFLSTNPLEEEFLISMAARCDTSLRMLVDDLFERDAAIEILCMYSLVQRDVINKSLAVHRLVQDVVRNQIPEAEYHRWSHMLITF